MRRAILAIALITSLAACSSLERPGSAGAIVAKGEDKLAKFEADYTKVKMLVDLAMPYLPQRRVDQIHAIEYRIEGAIALAHKAATVAEQLAHLKDAEAAAAELKAAAPPQPAN